MIFPRTQMAYYRSTLALHLAAAGSGGHRYRLVGARLYSAARLCATKYADHAYILLVRGRTADWGAGDLPPPAGHVGHVVLRCALHQCWFGRFHGLRQIWGVFEVNIHNFLTTFIFIRVLVCCREMALINIMLLAGLGLDASAFKKLWLMILRLTLVPTIAEVAIITVIARFTLDMPWFWGILLGWVYQKYCVWRNFVVCSLCCWVLFVEMRETNTVLYISSYRNKKEASALELFVCSKGAVQNVSIKFAKGIEELLKIVKFSKISKKIGSQ